MSHKATDWVRNHSPLKGSNKSVHIELAFYVHEGNGREDNNRVWPSVGLIAKRTGLSERSVQRALAKMEKLELITIERRDGRSNHFVVHIPEVISPTPVSLSPLVDVTPDTVSPPPLTDCHPTPDRVSPISSKGSSNPLIIKNNPPTPLSDGQEPEQVPTPKWVEEGSVVSRGVLQVEGAEAPEKSKGKNKSKPSYDPARYSPGGIRDPGSKVQLRSKYGSSNEEG